MTGRPLKNNAEYFTHDFDASDDVKIVYLESKFGLTGYAFYFKMLEYLTRCDNFKFQLNEITKAVYAKKIGVPLDLFNEILEVCLLPDISAFVVDQDGYLYSPGLTKRMQILIKKREYDRQRKENDRTSNEPDNNPEVFQQENTTFPTGKLGVKESKVKNSIVENNTEENTSCTEPETVSVPKTESPPEKIVISFPLNGKNQEYNVTESLVKQFEELYPGIDVMQTLRDIKGWCIANPAKRKTKNGALKFVNSWLARDQNDPRKHKLQTIGDGNSGQNRSNYPKNKSSPYGSRIGVLVDTVTDSFSEWNFDDTG